MKFATSLAALVAATMLYSVAASAATDEEVLRRLEALESKNAKLERSNAALERENANLRGRLSRPKRGNRVARTAQEGSSMPVSATPDAKYGSAAPPPPPFNWTGFYVGGHAGYGWQQIITPQSPGQTPPPKPNGGFWGGQVGVNYQFAPNWVVGVELDDSVARIENTVLQPDPLAPTTLLAFTGKVNSLMTLLARLGVTSDGNLFYVSGGPAWIRSQINSANGGAFVGSPGIVTHSETERGWAVGGGFERMLWSNWTGRIEYQYIHSNPFTVISLGGPSPGVRTDLQSVTVGVNYLFH